MELSEFTSPTTRFKGFCKQCGKEVGAYYKSQLPSFCSHKCSNQWKWDNVREHKKYIDCVCACCGKQFKIEASDHRIKDGQGVFYCSHICANKTIRKRNDKICPICGKMFNKRRTMTCSKECGYKLNSFNKYKEKHNQPNLTYSEYAELKEKEKKELDDKKNNSIKVVTSNGCIRYYEKDFVCVGREREYMKEYYNSHKKERAEKHNARMKNDEIYCFKTKVRRFISQSFKRRKESKIMSTKEILGCTFEDFMAHIVSKFRKGMSIENYGEWEIDHIIPLATAKTKEDIVKLCHYTNLQPLWASENRKKGAKLYKD